MSGEVTGRPAPWSSPTPHTMALAGFVLWLFVAPVLTQAVFLALGYREFEQVPVGALLLATGFHGLAVIALGFFTRRSGLLPLHPGTAVFGLGCYAVFIWVWLLAMVLFYAPLVEWVTGGGVPGQPQLLWFVEPETVPLFVNVLVVAVVAPAAEEVLFRGWLQSAMQKSFGTLVGLVFTAACFGLLHGLIYALPLAFLGLFFGWLRLVSRGLAAPIAAHIAHNGLMILVIQLSPDLVERSL